MSTLQQIGLPGRSIVVAADDPDLRDLMVQSLREAGAAVFPAYNADDALALCLYLRTDLLVVNARTAQLDGAELVRQLHEARPELAFLHIVAQATYDPIVEARLPPVVPILREPFSPNVFVQAVRWSLENTPMANERGADRRARAR
jgi:DNA-binding NtrC family response regulator